LGNNDNLNKLKLAGVLLTLGIVFGDIGTSPLYVLSAICGEEKLNLDLIYGAISCIFWTLTIQTTIKYVILTLRADNNGEGGIFSLYTLVRRRAKWLVIPAMIGGAALLADGMITPAISVTSAIEGLKIINPSIPVVPIVVVILSVLFGIQRFGTKVVGIAFGPIMLVWFTMLASLGIVYVFQRPEIITALNPWYAFNLLTQYPGGFWLLGGVFLCTTGAEALYSDLGHCGRPNIRVSWVLVKTCLMLNYLGQGAWLLQHAGEQLDGRNPFYYIMPEWFRLTGIIIATIATVIASQALISASYTLINEAMKLNLWPKVKVVYPTIQRGQIYIPSINGIVFIGCIGIVIGFQQAKNMEAAYGLTINFDMIMTTILLAFFLTARTKKKMLYLLPVLLFLSIEISFLISNLLKFPQGGWVSVTISCLLLLVMVVWFLARNIRKRYTELISIDKYLPMLVELSEDETVPKYATNLVYLTASTSAKKIEAKIVYSIFNKFPKRAEIYWFIHVNVVDEPYRMEFEVELLDPENVIRVELYLGFRVEQRVNLFLRKVVEDLVKNDGINVSSRYKSLQKYSIPGDFRFVVIERVMTYDHNLPFGEAIVMDLYGVLRKLSLSPRRAFGLDTSLVTVEDVPLIRNVNYDELSGLKRIYSRQTPPPPSMDKEE
jgi:KUP system potassium uptake protein